MQIPPNFPLFVIYVCTISRHCFKAGWISVRLQFHAGYYYQAHVRE